MTTNAIIATVICYAALGVLLLSLNFTSLWRWWVKAGAVVVTVIACVASYFCISGLLGWPASGTMPERFNLVATRVVEPDALRGDAGHIYLWVEEIDEKQIIISPPRSYEVPFEVEMFVEIEKAQEVLDGGGGIMGEIDRSEAEIVSELGTNRTDDHVGELSSGNDGGTVSGEGARFENGSANSLIFSDMPPVPLPSKGRGE